MIPALLLQAFLLVDGGDRPKEAEFDFPAPTTFDPMQDCHYRGDCPGHSYQKTEWIGLSYDEATQTSPTLEALRYEDDCNVGYCVGSLCTVTALYCPDSARITYRIDHEGVGSVVKEQLPLPCPEQNELIKGVIVDFTRVGGGAFLDLWSTEYNQKRCKECTEINPFGFSPDARRLIKGATVLGTVFMLHKLRESGHPVWAKWLGRGAFVFQVGLAANNVRLAHRK